MGDDMIRLVSPRMVSKIGCRIYQALALSAIVGRLRGTIRQAHGGLVNACRATLALLLLAVLVIALFPPSPPMPQAQWNHLPNRPSNVSPSNGTMVTSLTPTLSCSSFSDPDPSDFFALSQWEITLVPGDYSSAVYSSYEGGPDRTKHAIPEGTLHFSTTYFWHVRHQDQVGAWSRWSAETWFTTPPCSPDGWTEFTAPGRGLLSVWGTSPSDLFAVRWDVISRIGAKIQHYNGAAWTDMESGPTNELYGLWGSSSHDVFAVGADGEIVHYDGTAWSHMDSGVTSSLYDLWGSSSTDVFAVGRLGTILHYDGAVWGSMDSGTTTQLCGIWGNSSNDVFAVGLSGIILHYNGVVWSAMSSGTTQSLYAVWGASSDDVFAAGEHGGIVHYDGTAWSPMGSATSWSLYDIWGSSSSDVFAIGERGTISHYDGSIWSLMDGAVTDGLTDVWGTSATDVFVLSQYGRMLYYRGAVPLTSVSPSHGYLGENLVVTITGTYVGGIIFVGFGSGITVNSFTMDGPSQITADITVDSTASPGLRRVMVATEGGNLIKPGAFTVKRGVPTITSVMPSHGYQGQYLEVSITGTHLIGASSVYFGSGVFVSEVTFESDTEIKAMINISFSATPGVRDITITTPGGTSNEGAFTVFPDWTRPDGQILQTLSSEVAALREMTLGSVPIQLVTRDELRELLLKNSEDDLNQVATAQDLYVLLDFLEEGQNLYDILIEAYTQEILGFYDPENDELCLVSYTGEFGPLERLILVHEYAHALQDQHFNLTSLWKKDYNSDVSMAVNSLVEGDAMLVTGAYYLRFLSEPECRLIGDLTTEPGSELGDDVPRVIREILMFPYMHGVKFAGAIFSDGGWEAVNRAYKYPPKSTEQIMHPEKYYRHKDDPMSVTLPNIAAALGTGWSELDSDVFGEFGLLLYLEAFLDPSDAAKAAEGWGGDRYAFLKDDAGRRLFLLSSVWDSKKDAREFYGACAARAQRKSGDDVSPVLKFETERRWQSEGYSLYLRQDGTSVVLIIAPDETVIDTLLSGVGSDLAGQSEAGGSRSWMWVTIGVSAIVVLVASALVVRQVARRRA